jgi:hypothetical protein
VIMRPASLLLSLALTFALAGCGGPSGAPASPPPPLPSETPPTTRDPGAVRDDKPLKPSRPPAPEGGEPAAEPVPGRPVGAACLISSECESGVCEGEGCTDDRPGTCVARSRACTRDLRQYCGCDGKTFGASGSCPGRRFAARGPCGA